MREISASLHVNIVFIFVLNFVTQRYSETVKVTFFLLFLETFLLNSFQDHPDLKSLLPVVCSGLKARVTVDQHRGYAPCVHRVETSF